MDITSLASLGERTEARKYLKNVANNSQSGTE